MSWPLGAPDLPIVDLARPSRLSLALRPDAAEGTAAVEVGADIVAGQPLFEAVGCDAQPCPVSGKVLKQALSADIRGGRPRPTLVVEPSAVMAPSLDALDPETATEDELFLRLRQAGLLVGELAPTSLAETLALSPKGAVERVVVLAADREPGLGAGRRLFSERASDAVTATRLLGRIANAEASLAVLEADRASATELCAGSQVEIVALPPRYPESLEPMVAARVGGSGVRVVGLESALAALDAVRDGQLQSTKVLTVIGPEGTTANYRALLGTPVQHILAQAGLEPLSGDKVLVGGPMRGMAQTSLDSGIDAGVEAIVLMREGDLVQWSDEPCVNCGTCIDACPVNLQVHLIGRYAEFGLFENTAALDIDQCIRCGLCASVCVARRPLLQLIDLCRSELAKEGR